MKRSWTILGAGLLTFASVGIGSGVATAQPVRDSQQFSVKVESGSDADKTIARAKVVTQVIEKILEDWSFSAIRGERRKKLVHSVFSILRDEKFKEARRGGWQYVATVSMNEAKQNLLNELEVEQTFGADQYIIVPVDRDNWWRGEGLSADEQKYLPDSVARGCSQYLISHRFRESPAASQAENVARAAISLGADPQTSQMHDFAAQFQAPLVVAIKGNIKFEEFPAGSPQAQQFRGYLRCQGVTGRLYDKNSDTILANFNIRSDKSINNEQDASRELLHQPWVGKMDSVSEAAEAYAQLIGKYIAKNIMYMLFNTFYAGQPENVAVEQAQAAGGASGPRECPGCMDKIIDASITTCPACESPLPAPAGGAVASGGGGGNGGGGSGLRKPTPRDYYNLRFKGFTDTDIDSVVDALGEYPECGNFKDKGSMGVFRVVNFTYVGSRIAADVNAALQDAGISGAKVNQTGNNINVLK